MRPEGYLGVAGFFPEDQKKIGCGTYFVTVGVVCLYTRTEVDQTVIELSGGCQWKTILLE